MDRLLWMTGSWFGPIFGTTLIGVYLLRLCFPKVQILFELTEPALALFCAVFTIAIVGVAILII